MERALRKLHSQQGASILLALLFFLVCAFVGAVILGSATTNAQKVQERREDQQVYYAVSSAAQLLRDAMNGSVFEGWENLVEYSCAYGHGDRGSHLCSDTEFLKGQKKSLLSDAAWAVYCSQLRFSHSGVTKGPLPYKADFTVTAEGLPDVAGKLTMEEDYSVTILLRAADSNAHTMTMQFRAAASTEGPVMNYQTDPHQERTGTDEAGNAIFETVFYERTETAYKTRIAWESAVISKGDTVQAEAGEVTPSA